MRVEVRRLERILDEHLPQNTAIDFRSLDGEGHDLRVLRSNNWTRYRPEVVVVEDFDFAPPEFEPETSRFLKAHGYKLDGWRSREFYVDVAASLPFGRPRQDSNLRTRLRRPMLYPLSYEGVGPAMLAARRAVARSDGPPSDVAEARSTSMPAASVGRAKR